MRYLFLAPSHIKATIQLPTSKSTSNHVLIIHVLSEGGDVLSNLSDCGDTKVMVEALTEGGGVIDILAAGVAMYFLTAYPSSTPDTHIIIGMERMQQCLIQVLVNVLRELGASTEYAHNEGFPPLRIERAPSAGNEITLKGSVSSQYISALLVIELILKSGLQLRLTGEVVSRPYISLTPQLMKDFGALAWWTSNQNISVELQPYRCVLFTAESDWSVVSYWYRMAILFSGAGIELTGLFRHSYQGDNRGVGVLARLGIEAEYTEEGMWLRKNGSCVKRLDEDFVDILGLAQAFVVTCALLDVSFRFTGSQSLRIRETDHIEALRTEMKKLGYVLHDGDDGILYWSGEHIEPQTYPVIETYEDHCVAMAFVPAAIHYLITQIDEPQVVSKSYPRYWDDLRKAGFVIEMHAMETSGRQ